MFADGVRSTLHRFYGETAKIDSLCLLPDDDPQHFQARIEQVYRLNQPSIGFLILADIPGGNVCNAAINVAKIYEDIRVVTGLNLKMALDACTLRTSLTLDALCIQVSMSGRDSIEIH
jgi:mannose/fructose-specific phosphotransferase system component IIA